MNLPAIARRRMTENPCPVGCCAEIISGKWTLLMIRDLADGSRRFCELERSLEGISPRTLSLRLRALEENGIVERRTREPFEHAWPGGSRGARDDGPGRGQAPARAGRRRRGDPL